MGGGGGILSPITNTLFGKPKTVDAPNYTGAAEQTSASNLAANRVNQSNPYGSLSYQQTGTDQYGNPTWSQTQTVNPQLQAAIQNNLSQLGQNFQAPSFQGQDMAAMNYFGSKLNQQQFDPNSLQKWQLDTSKLGADSLPSYGINPGQSYEQAIMSRLQPQIQRETNDLEAKLANQGIMEGSEAYNRAIQSQQQNINDRLTSAVVGGMQTGLQANQQQFGQNFGIANAQLGANQYNNQQAMGANQLAYQQQLANQDLGMRAQNQGFNQALSQAMLPYQQGAALMGLASPNFASIPMVAGTDYMGATGLTNQANQANANAYNAQNNAMMSGLFNLAGAGIKKYG
jgi:hypothetical protein